MNEDGYDNNGLGGVAASGTGMVVLVTGGRTFDSAKAVNKAMAQLQEMTGRTIECVIQGGARGADDLGRRWAENRGVPVIEMRANWQRYGKRAGPMRNAWMLRFCRPDYVVAFPGSAGTAHMVRIAGEHALPIFFASPNPTTQEP